MRILRSRNLLLRRLGLIAIFRRITLVLLLELCLRRLIRSSFLMLRTQKIYAMAAKVKPVLYQQPCYCRCDREVGHTSLLDCFGDNHGSICDVCKKEAVYSYQQTKLGKSAAEIRAGIMAGKWKQVDLAKVDSAAVAGGAK